MTKDQPMKDLEKLTRTKLIEEAQKYPDIEGASGMTKDELLVVIATEKKKLGEEAREEAPEKPAAPKKKAGKQPDRVKLKATLKDLKKKRQDAEAAKDGVLLKRIRTRYKKVNRLLRRVSTPAG